MTVLDRLEASEVFEGWDTLQAYLLVRGRLEVGHRVEPYAATRNTAWQMVACAQFAAAGWEGVEFDERVPAVPAGDGWTWEALYPLTAKLGVAIELVALVEGMHPAGEWRVGAYPGLHFTIASREQLLVARVVDDEVVALLAPCVRADDACPLCAAGHVPLRPCGEAS